MRFVKPFAYFSLSLLLPLLFGCAGPSIAVKEVSPARGQWVEQTLRSLTLEEKVGQMIMSRAYGYYYGSRSDEYRRIEDLVRRRKIGGLVVFQGDVVETPMVLNRLQSLASIPLLVGSDCEWGTAMRIRRGTRFPEDMALGATRDTTLAFRVGMAVGSEMRALGMHQDYAPVVDVNRNPLNPVINTRAFGERADLVASMAGAYIRGLQSEHILATAKHFPGHGDTDVDSHLSLPVVSHSRTQLDSIDFVPYRSAVRRDVASVMIGHLEVPSIEQGAPVPATLSESVIGGVLRHDLGFGGLVVTDAMEMGALVNSFGADSAAVRAVAAGADMLLLVPDEDAAVNAITAAVRSGRIPAETIDRAVRNILSVKWDMGLSRKRSVPVDSVAAIVGSPEHLALAKEVARRSITVLSNDGVLPLTRFEGKRLLNLIVADAEHYRTEIHRTSSPWPNEDVGDYLTMQIRRRSAVVTTVRIDPSSDEIDFKHLITQAERSDVILCSVFSKARSGSGQFGLPAELVHIVDTMRLLHKPHVLVAMGSPYVISAFGGWDAYVCAYSDCEVSTEAVAEALYGEIPVGGKSPVSIPNMFVYGDGLNIPQAALRRDPPEANGFNRDSLARVDTIIARAIRDGAFPGAQVLIGRNGAIVYDKAFGGLTYAPESPRVTLSTMYDLASLTKVVATTTAVMRLCDEGKLRLGDRLVDILPACDNHGKDKITIRNLLLHNGGLPPFKRLFLTCTSPEQVLDSVYQTEMIYRTGDSTVYSDFDFILLGKIVEKLSGVSLDRYVDSVFFEPLGMTRTMYTPPASYLGNIAPTEYDSVYRKRLVQGIVHDENAYALGGVSGHAGLFATASDLAVFLQMLMNGGSYAGVRYLNPETVRLFTTKETPSSTRLLGWDTKTVTGYSTAGTLFGPQSFGHTGFTGTSLWVDPDRNLFVIFLTNRVHPTRANSKIARVRPELHDAVVRAITSELATR